MVNLGRRKIHCKLQAYRFQISLRPQQSPERRQRYHKSGFLRRPDQVRLWCRSLCHNPLIRQRRRRSGSQRNSEAPPPASIKPSAANDVKSKWYSERGCMRRVDCDKFITQCTGQRLRKWPQLRALPRDRAYLTDAELHSGRPVGAPFPLLLDRDGGQAV